jgi:kumamolisin
MATAHVELAGSRRAPPHDAVRLRDIEPDARIEVTVTLKGPDLPALDRMPDRALSRAEIDNNWGVPASTVQKVERVLRSFGLRVQDVKQAGRSLRVTGSATAMTAAFQPKLAIYQVLGQGQIRGREGPLMIPSQLDGLITGVDGFDQRRMAHRHVVARYSHRRAEPLVAATAGLEPLSPADLQQRYNFPPGDGSGESIIIAEFGSPLDNGQVLPPAFIESDVAAFCAMYGIPEPTVGIEPINIAPLNQQQYETAMRRLPPPLQQLLGAQTAETMMDVEIIAALCPAANIAVYFASWDQKGWVDLLDDATSDNHARPVAISISYGLAEEAEGWSQGAMNSINHRLQIAAMQGINVCVSSGDDGTGCGLGGRRCHVPFPAASPFVLSVGGTMLRQGAGGQITEVGWWEAPGQRTPRGGGSPGGGVSVLNPRPPWQTVQIASLNPGAPDGRVVPDVAALAGRPLYELLLDGRPFPDGGTSASAPLWAALIARIDAGLSAAKRQRFLPPLIYQAAVANRGFRDIVSGNNASYPTPGKGYECGPGFDAVTGWGIPDGVALLNALEQV